MKQFIIGFVLGLGMFTTNVYAVGPGNIFPSFGNVGIGTENLVRLLVGAAGHITLGPGVEIAPGADFEARVAE